MKKIYVFLSAVLLGSGAFAQGETCATATVVSQGTYNANGPATGGGGATNACFASGTVNNADWYSFTPACDGLITVSSDGGANTGTGYDSRLSIYSGTCGALVCEDSDDDGGANPNFSSTVSNLAVTGGTTYLIEWDDRWDDGAFEWFLTYVNPNAIQNLTSANITPVSVDLDWDPIAAETDWDIEYGPAGFTLGSGTVVPVSGTSDHVLNGLNAEVSYDIYVGISGDACSFTMVNVTTPPLCPIPTAPMTTVGATDASMSWTNGGTEVEWDVEYGEAGFVLGSGDVFEDNTGSNPFNTPASSLNGSTDYHWYVRAVCQVAGNEEVSYWVGPNVFTTDPTCPAPLNFTATLVDTFEMQLNWDFGGTETAWSIEYGPAGFAMGSGTSFSVTTSNDTLIDGLDPDTDYDFYVMADCGAGDMSTVVGPAMATTGVACTEVSGLSISGLTTTSVNMNWTPNAGNTPMETEWNMVYGETGFDPLTEGTTDNVTSLPHAVTGLMAGTSYQYYVEAVCGVDTNSVWVGPFTFTTVIACPKPTNLNVMNVTNTAANLIFQAGDVETAWNIEWGSTGFMPDNGEEFGSVMTTMDNPFYATGLNASSTYEYYVQASCGGSDLSTWAGPFQFSTLLGNDEPCDAIEITVDAADTNVYNNFGATVDMNEGNLLPAQTTFPDLLTNGWLSAGAGNDVDNSVWFKFTSPASGVVTVSTADNTGLTNFDAEVAVFESTDCGTYSTYAELGANTLTSRYTNDNTFIGGEVVLCGLTGGQEYLVMVDGFGGSNGEFMIAVNSTPAAVAGTAVSGYSCSADGSLDLFDFVTGFSTGNGSFYFPDATQTDPDLIFAGDDGELVLTGLDPLSVYPFDYVVGSGCNTDIVSIEAVYADQPYAGIGDTVTTCVSQNVDLGDHLMGVVATGGVWSDDDNATGLVNGVFNTGAVAAGTYNFTYVLDNGLCADSSVVTVIVESCLGVDANEVASLEVFPNPVNNELTIANLNVEGQAVITVVDVQGKVVMTNAINNVNGNYILDMSKLENGVYVVTVRTNDSVENVRVIKQ